MFYLMYGLLYLLSLLPLRLLYLLSDFSYLVIFYVAGYRKKVVAHNLSIAFPQLTGKERDAVARKFYKGFTDSFIENIKLLSASEKFIRKHFVGDYQVFKYLEEKGYKKLQLHSGHFFNWEYGNLSIPLHTNYLMLGVYMPISSNAFDKLFYRLRSRTGSKLISATNIRKEILPYRDEKSVLALIADQSPADPRNAFWVNFFGRPTPFLKAPESGARRGNNPVVFCHFVKLKRGYYRIDFHLEHEQPGTTGRGELTKNFAAYLQRSIEHQPENYLWSHRRWKWQWKEEYGEIL